MISSSLIHPPPFPLTSPPPSPLSLHGPLPSEIQTDPTLDRHLSSNPVFTGILPIPSSLPLFPTLHLLHLRSKVLFSACSLTISQARNQAVLPGFFLPLTCINSSFSCEGLKLRFLLRQVCYGFAFSPRVCLLIPGGGPCS